MDMHGIVKVRFGRLFLSLSLTLFLSLSDFAQIMEDYDLEFLYNSGALLTRLVGDPPQVLQRI